MLLSLQLFINSSNEYIHSDFIVAFLSSVANQALDQQGGKLGVSKKCNHGSHEAKWSIGGTWEGGVV